MIADSEQDNMWLEVTSDVPIQVALLQRYNISLSDSTMKQLEEAPIAWAALQKKITTKCVIAPFTPLPCGGGAWSQGQRTVSMLL